MLMCSHGAMPLRVRSRLSLLAGTAAVAALVLSGCAASAGGADAAGDAGSGLAEAVAADEVLSVDAIEPAVGALSGGTAVTISGDGFDGDSAVTSVLFGSEPAASFEVTDDGTLTAVTPASFNFVVGDVPVVVALEDGSQVTSGTAATADGSAEASGTVFGYEIQTAVDSQMAYAFTYWQDYNLAEWGEFPDNDCGNFVNQTMLARGWVQDADWYSDYVAIGDYSYSWIRGNEMDAYYASRPDTTRYEFTDRSQLKIGDVVMFDWDPENGNGVDHTMIISKVTHNADGTISIAMVGHTLDATYRDLDNAVTVEKPGGTAHFWSIA